MLSCTRGVKGKLWRRPQIRTGTGWSASVYNRGMSHGVVSESPLGCERWWSGEGTGGCNLAAMDKGRGCGCWRSVALRVMLGRLLGCGCLVWDGRG